jgi:hypothetical protein
MKVERASWFGSFSVVTGVIEALAAIAAMAWLVRWLIK